MARTRIVATLGPASSTDERIAALIDAGVDVFRLNLSHGTRDEHAGRIAAIRRTAGTRPTAILLDLAGPKLRLTHPVRGRPGDVVELALPTTVRPGDPVLLADGVMQLEVIDAGHSRVIVGGDIPERKGVNLPASRLDLASLTDKDREDLRFAVALGVDFIALSFVRRASDLDETKAAGLPVIAKVETAFAVERLEEIAASADGVMVARGDLGVEIPIERVPIVQKQLIALANRLGKPVITATQMLRSMVDSLVPTRAEATDVANAVLDGTDAVMLSEESAIGQHPVEAVKMLARIAAQAEQILVPRTDDPRADVADVIAHAACETATRLDAAAIVVPTQTGTTARRVVRRRPRIPVIALTPDDGVRRRLSLVWGVTAITAPWPADDIGKLLAHFRPILRKTGLVADGATVVVTAGWPTAGTTNLLHVTTL
jgi:pyruvate kinase